MSLLRANSEVDQISRTKRVLRHIQMIPLSWLGFSFGKRLLLVVCSYPPAIIGLLIFFPLSHNGSTMFLTMVSTCWLFRYRGLLISLLLNGAVFQLAYIFMWRGMLPDNAFVQGGLLGFITSLGLGLIVCWLRTAVDLVYESRQQTLLAEQERLRALEAERLTVLAYENQRKLNSLKDDFLLHVSHEFRTPLTVLGGVLDLLCDYRENLQPADQADLLVQAQVNQQDLAYLVDRILGAATVMGELPEAHSEALSIHQVVQDVLAYLNTRGGRVPTRNVQDYIISVRIPEHLEVWADPQFLRQVLENLLLNVFKYVPAQTEVLITAIQAASSSQVCLSVQDAGPGIPVEEAPLLFEKFVRLKRDLTSSTSGTGLGLYTCKRFVEAMGGHIWVESSGRAGEGSCFSFTLPTVSSSSLA